jgi:hypothetical protein
MLQPWLLLDGRTFKFARMRLTCQSWLYLWLQSGRLTKKHANLYHSIRRLAPTKQKTLQNSNQTHSNKKSNIYQQVESFWELEQQDKYKQSND